MAFSRVSSTTVYEGHVISVTADRFLTPTGSTVDREIVHHPGAVVVVPVTEAGEAVMVRQYRAAIGALLLEVPAGKRDVDGESPDVTAARELAEEVGLSAGRLDLLARFYNSPGFCDEFTHLYLARDLTTVADSRQGEEEEAMTIEHVPLAAVPAMIDSGQLVDAKSIIALTLAAARIG
jgi:8-oxo-dGTP pyrophosphatase MutT (NUDIX family)